MRKTHLSNLKLPLFILALFCSMILTNLHSQVTDSLKTDSLSKRYRFGIISEYGFNQESGTSNYKDQRTINKLGPTYGLGVQIELRLGTSLLLASGINYRHFTSKNEVTGILLQSDYNFLTPVSTTTRFTSSTFQTIALPLQIKTLFFKDLLFIKGGILAGLQFDLHKNSTYISTNGLTSEEEKSYSNSGYFAVEFGLGIEKKYTNQ